VIDDEPDLQESIDDVLKYEDYELHFANNGKEGLVILKEVNPILILLDLRMPVMSGLEVLQQLQVSSDDPYSVIVLTGHGDDDDIQKCYELGVHAFLRKPFNIFELQGLVKQSITIKQTMLALVQAEQAKSELLFKKKSMLLKNFTLLYVEDDTNMQNNMLSFFGDKVKEFYQAVNGKDGLQIYTDKHPDIILTDISMPIMSGLEMSQIIRSSDAEKPILLFSAFESIEFLKHAINIGINGFISKPIKDIKQLLDLLETQALNLQNRIDAKKLISSNEENRKLKDRLELVIKGSNDGIWDWDLLDNRIYFSARWKEMLGYTDSELSNEFFNWEDRIHPDDLTSVMAEIQTNLDGKSEHYENAHRLKHKDGHWVWILSRGKTQYNSLSKAIRMTGTHTDISEKKEADEQIRLAASVFAYSQEGILITDKNNRIVEVNPSALEFSGYTRKEVIGKNPSLFSSGRQNKEFFTQMWKNLHDSGHWQGEIWNRKKSGEIYSERISIDVVSDSKGNIQHFVAVFNDITYLKEQEAELERIAYNDALTGLPNRLLLRDRMKQALSKAIRIKKILAFCYLDLDGFKPVNDIYGHKTGDAILVEVAKRLVNTVRADDTVARIGGDEFVLLMQDIDAISELKQALERILSAISSDYSFTDDDQIIKIDFISASIGVTLYPQDRNKADLLLRHADQAMYQAKQRGKNRYIFFAPKEEQPVENQQK